ncbi:hypothetical protein Golob_013023 [Gossypium lobatum]|uniref:RNase H type-1 domain-containing protein n=1 Tax=Gossypium lobatum TaxID=34289 RepID=A0A7J8LN51_9ROSI|nr:hypothetical protein [Gossypium lobatum]
MSLDMRHSAVEIEDDDLAIVKKVNVNVEDGSVINAFIKYLKALSEGYDRFHFVHNAKGRNVVAHLLATKGIKRGENNLLGGKVIVPDLAYMEKGDWSPKELLVGVSIRSNRIENF